MSVWQATVRGANEKNRTRRKTLFYLYVSQSFLAAGAAGAAAEASHPRVAAQQTKLFSRNDNETEKSRSQKERERSLSRFRGKVSLLSLLSLLLLLSLLSLAAMVAFSSSVVNNLRKLSLLLQIYRS